MKGTVTDKGTGLRIPDVMVLATDSTGKYLEDSNGMLGTSTNSKGEWNYDLLPGQYLSFEKPAYPRIIKSYETLVRSGKIVMDDASGTSLTKAEIKAYLSDMRKMTSAQWMIGIGLTLLVIAVVWMLIKKGA